MKFRFYIIIVMIVILSLLCGCDEIFNMSQTSDLNPYIPELGTPIPEPNAPIKHTPIPQETQIPSESPAPTDTQQPAESTSPTQAPTTKPTPTPTAVPTAEPTAIPTAEPTAEPTPEPTVPPIVELIPKIGFLSDDSDNTAYSLSAMAWAGIQNASLDFEYEPVFIELPAMDDGTIMAHIDILVTEECEIIVLPSFRFSSALSKAHILYPDTSFILFGYDGFLGDNVLTVIFSEFQAGFLAGAASALELSSSLGLEVTEFGIIIAEDTAGASLYMSGFIEGVSYTASSHGTNALVDERFITYLQNPGDPEEALYAAYSLYDSGATCLLNLAGSSSSAVIQAAVDANGWEIPAYVVGVAYDSFTEGLLPNGSSVVLTSAMTYFDTAAYEVLSDYATGDFAGGTQRFFDYASGGIGISADSSDFSPETMDTLTYIYEQMDLNWLQVPPLGDGPITILAPPPVPVPTETPTIPPLPSETPTIPPIPSETPTIPPLP